MKCIHDMAEKDTEVADGACPLCMTAELEQLREALAEARTTIARMAECVSENAGIRNEYQDFDEVHELKNGWLQKWGKK